MLDIGGVEIAVSNLDKVFYPKTGFTKGQLIDYLELHTFLHKTKAINRPTALAFDLDPGPPADVLARCDVALKLKAFFDALGLRCFAKTSGFKGMQVYLPLNTAVPYEQTKNFAHELALLLERRFPALVVSKMIRPAKGPATDGQPSTLAFSIKGIWCLK